MNSITFHFPHRNWEEFIMTSFSYASGGVESDKEYTASEVSKDWGMEARLIFLRIPELNEGEHVLSIEARKGYIWKNEHAPAFKEAPDNLPGTSEAVLLCVDVFKEKSGSQRILSHLDYPCLCITDECVLDFFKHFTQA